MDNKLSINANVKEIISETLFHETCEIAETDGKILGVTASSTIIGCEALNSEARVSVRTGFRIVRFDGENYNSDVISVESVKVIPNSGITPTTDVVLFASVTDCDKISAFKVRATVSLSGWYVQERTLDILDNNMNGVFCKCETQKIERVIPLVMQKETLSNTDEARMPIEKILDYSADICVNNVYLNNGSYRVEGDISIRVLMVTDNKQFVTQTFNHNYGVDFADENVNNDSVADVVACIKDVKITVTESDKRIIVSDVTASFYGIITNTVECNNVLDAYSLTNVITLYKEDKKVNTHFCLRTVRDKVSSVVKDTGAVEIIGALCPVVSATNVSNEDGLFVEGVVGVNVLYLTESHPEVKKVEVPFKVRVSTDFICDGIICPFVTVPSTIVRLRGSSDLEVTVELVVTVRGIKLNIISLGTDLEIGDVKEIDDFAISLYVVKQGETLYDVAKALNTEESTLTRLNEDISFPLKGGEKVLFYKEEQLEI